MTDANHPDIFTEGDCIVAVNDQDQHALWPATLDLPPGWHQRPEGAQSRWFCLDAIARSWPDIAPATVRSGQPAHPHGAEARLVPELFAEQAGRRPDAVAVASAGGAQLTYRELDESANRLARYLLDLGAGPEVMIGVHLERGAEAIRSLLAIMKTGSGYLPLDPSLPPARLAQVCVEASPMAVLADRSEKRLWPSGTKVLPISKLTAALERQAATAPQVRLQPDQLCYAIHTSGSTGRPKAVGVSHHSLACVIPALAGEYQISAEDRVVQLASLAFDTSVEQILVTLTSGATLMLPPAGTVAPTDLLGYLEREQVTVIDLTPAYWHQLLASTEPDDRRLRSVRLMITGGEMADPADCAAARRAAPGARLLNAYGLTETTITSALFDVGAAGPVGPVPVGRAIGPARIMVLDETLGPVPAGQVGEVYIGGSGVARGYLGQPALTAETFLPDRGGPPGSRMYRTGDLGRVLADGNLEVTGRADRQLKVRGFRVEPAEIESVLAGHPDIGQVAVVTAGQGPGDTRLAAYYTRRDPGSGHGDPTAASLRRFLRARLPGYMIPAVFVALDHIPPVPGGLEARLDQDPHDQAPDDQVPDDQVPGDQAGPLTPVQAGMSYLWSGLLRHEHVGLDDDFFALGGNSLLAAEMLTQAVVMFGIGTEYVRPLTRSLLRNPTLREFAQAAQDARAGQLDTDGDQAPVDFAREAQLGAASQPRSHAGDARTAYGRTTYGRTTYGRPDGRRPREILLTGSTGFFGAHLLRELLASTGARVWCLVRARDAAEAMTRIAAAGDRYELASLPSGRVVPLPGDLTLPHLGLSPGEFRELARSSDVIYHAGAAVNFIYPYEELRAANVAGTREVIRLAMAYRGIPVHFVSTTAVLAGLGMEGVREVTEDTPLAHADRLRMGYVETKFVAEELLRHAGRAGLPVAIYRPLDIVGRTSTGAWNTATEMCALMRFITDTGLAPDIELPLDFVPADVCAAAIRHISTLEGATGRTYHLASPHRTMLGALVGRLREHGFIISEIPYDAWVSELLRHAARNPSHPMTPFLPLFIDRDHRSGLTVAEMYFDHVFPRYTRSNTEQALQGSGIDFPAVDGGLLDTIIRRLIATGFLNYRVPAQRGQDQRGQDQRGPDQVPGRPAHAG